ncbi:MAG: hypothetical protein U1A25_03000 [Candidatus Sungbacteria bacterium]|nr:hypothetical protein [bacterium]MDZ4260611.1 hypothetical protein [Candidatus Sungbacteria bacterium]
MNGKAIHVSGYQNRVQNLAGIQERKNMASDPYLPERDYQRRSGEEWGWHTPTNTPSIGIPMSRGTGNAMILPFPAIPGTMTRKNIISTASCPHILEDMEKALEKEEFFSPMRLMSLGIPRDRIEIFEHDIYTVVLAPYGAPIVDALADVPAEKRPPLNKHFFDGFTPLYADWTFGLCCFNNKDAALAKPLLWWYEPMRPDLLFLPALDCHTGQVPDLKAYVEVDHTVAVSSDNMSRYAGTEVTYRDSIPYLIRPYIASRVIGMKMHTNLPNGDFVFRVSDIDKGKFDPRRLLPPGAQKE